MLSAPDGESPVLLPVPPLFLLAGPAVLAQPGSGVHRHLQSPAPVCRREETVAKYPWVSDSKTRKSANVREREQELSGKNLKLGRGREGKNRRQIKVKFKNKKKS